MTHRNISITIVLLTVLAVMALGFNAFAGPGDGYGRKMGYGPQADCGFRGGPGQGQSGFAGIGPRGARGYGYAPTLSAETLAKIESQRNAFFEATQETRQALYAKHLELKSEMIKKDPDAQKASDLQTEISNLRARLDQQRIAHRIEMHKINPNMGIGGRGAGRSGFGGGRGSRR